MSDVNLKLSFDAFAAIRGALPRYLDHAECLEFRLRDRTDVTEDEKAISRKLVEQIHEAIAMADEARAKFFHSEAL